MLRYLNEATTSSVYISVRSFIILYDYTVWNFDSVFN